MMQCEKANNKFLSNEMTIEFNMLGSFMKDRVSCNIMLPDYHKTISWVGDEKHLEQQVDFSTTLIH